MNKESPNFRSRKVLCFKSCVPRGFPATFVFLIRVSGNRELQLPLAAAFGCLLAPTATARESESRARSVGIGIPSKVRLAMVSLLAYQEPRALEGVSDSSARHFEGTCCSSV